MPIPLLSVDIWRIDLTEEQPSVLSERERERAAKFRFEQDRVRWERAHSVLRSILAEYLMCDPLQFDFDVGPHGKPEVGGSRDIRFNLSHSGDQGLVAVTTGVPVGVDIERYRARVDISAMLRRLGEPDVAGATVETEFQRWATREARSKAAGGPLMTPPSGDIVAVSLEVAAGYAGAVALVGATPQAVYRCR